MIRLTLVWILVLSPTPIPVRAITIQHITRRRELGRIQIKQIVAIHLDLHRDTINNNIHVVARRRPRDRAVVRTRRRNRQAVARVPRIVTRPRNRTRTTISKHKDIGDISGMRRCGARNSDQRGNCNQQRQHELKNTARPATRHGNRTHYLPPNLIDAGAPDAPDHYPSSITHPATQHPKKNTHPTKTTPHPTN